MNESVSRAGGMRDLRLPLWSKLILLSSALLCGVGWLRWKNSVCGMILTAENRTIQIKLCPLATFYTTKSSWTGLVWSLCVHNRGQRVTAWTTEWPSVKYRRCSPHDKLLVATFFMDRPLLTVNPLWNT